MICLVIPLTIISQEFHERGVTRVPISPYTEITQRIGLTDITIAYYSPRAMGRKIFGAVVPYGKIWRAGANENTTITLTSRAKIAGKEILPGTYGMHIIPKEDSWTIIFSTNHTSWGSFFYDESEDQIRIDVIPEDIVFIENLKFEFENVNQYDVNLTLKWGDKMISIPIQIPTNEVVVELYRLELRGLPRFKWYGRCEAALFCVANAVNLDEAIEWIDQSISQERRFENLIVKADLLKKLGRSEEHIELISELKSLGNYQDFQLYGWQKLNHYGKPNQAIEAWKLMDSIFPGNPYTDYLLGIGYARLGNNSVASIHFKSAYQKGDSTLKQTVKDRIIRYEIEL